MRTEDKDLPVIRSARDSIGAVGLAPCESKGEPRSGLAARSIADNSGWTQLISSAGVSQDEAVGMSLTEIAAAKFDRDTQN